MEQLYINQFPITYEKNILYSGEEADIYRYQEKLLKIFKKERRANLPPIQADLYAYFTKIEVSTFYLPREIAVNDDLEFRGYTMAEFPQAEIGSHAQSSSIMKLLPSIEQIEQDAEKLSNLGIQIKDLKLEHILYCAKSSILGIIDCGIYQKSDHKNLWIENLKEVNYYLRQALLWANYEGTKHEMIGIDFPEIYDYLDEGTMKLSEVLKEEVSKYQVETFSDLKKVYQKMRFY